MINLLIISPDFNKCCGVSKHVYLQLRELKKQEPINLFFLTNKGDNLNKITELGINFALFSFSKENKSIFKAYKFFRYLKEFCKKENINIIHSHHRYPEFIAWLVSKFNNTKTVTTVHSKVIGFPYLSFHSQRIICVSDYIRNMIINDFKRRSNVFVLYNFVDELYRYNSDTDEIKERLNINKDDKIILFVGRITKIKGVDILLQAFKKIKGVNNNLHLFLIGEQAKNENLSFILEGDGVRVVNPTNSISDFYKISDLVVLPSRIEPLGYVMLEAGIYKIPFIGSNTGGIAEFINNREHGILVEPEDIDGLSNSIMEVLFNPVLKTHITENLYKKVRLICNKDIYIEELMNIYKNLLYNK